MSFFASRNAGILAWLRLALWEEHWSIGLIDGEAFWRCVENGTLAEKDVQWLRSGKGFFLADPCWISESRRLIAAESFQYRRRLGRIVSVQESRGRATSMRTIKAGASHYSYPMVYARGDTCVIIPESADDNRVSAIVIDANGKVICETAVLRGRRLVDPTVFRHCGSYWMFANPLNNFDNELAVFRGDSIVGPWYQTALHSLPIPNCRGAGRVFEKDGTLYWPTQYNSRRYGGGIIMRRIVSLTETHLEHEIVSLIRPDPKGSRPLGFHTVSTGERQYLVDGLAYRFSPLKPFYVLATSVRRRFLRSAGGQMETPMQAGPAGQ